MSLRLIITGLEGEAVTFAGRAASVCDCVLRGVGQVFFQKNLLSGTMLTFRLLVVVALCGVGPAAGLRSIIYVAAGAVLAPFVAAVCAAALEPIGRLAAETLPFVLVGWVSLAGRL